MKKRILYYFPLFVILISCEQRKEKIDQTAIDRIDYVYNLKSFVGENIWKDFDNADFDVPLIYYTDSCCYIANPTEKFVNEYNPEFVFRNSRIEVYRTPLLDSIPFHMHVSVSFDSIKEYDYRSPFMKCSSTEITNKIIPDVPSTEVWATMILHEYFHGFQFKHKDFFDYFENNIAFFTQDTLKYIYSHNEWFKESINKENDLLLSALVSTDSAEIKTFINSFFQLRNQRREDTKQKLNLNIKPIEEIFETMEGTARYVEYRLYDKFTTKQPDIKLLKSDTLYHSYSYFNAFNLKEAQWLYKTGNSYFYGIGFNIIRLLDKLGIEYKSRLFYEGRISSEEILKTEYGS